MDRQRSPSFAELRAAKRHATQLLGQREGVEGLGIGDGCVQVYVRARALAAELPDEVDGVPLLCIEVGDITPR